MLHSLTSLSAGQLPLDPSRFHHVNEFAGATGWLHAPLRAYAQYGVILFALALVAAWWRARRSDDASTVAAALWAPVGTLLALAANQPLVHWVDEPRPYTALPHVLVLVSRGTDASFPSDHAVMAGAVTAGVFLVSRRLGVITGVGALLMGFARVYVGAHYPGDVLAGLLFGALVTLAGLLVFRPLLTSLVGVVSRTPLRMLVTAAVTGEGRPARR
jgi:membrane-associated phospholipid phosphatase